MVWIQPWIQSQSNKNIYFLPFVIEIILRFGSSYFETHINQYFNQTFPNLLLNKTLVLFLCEISKPSYSLWLIFTLPEAWTPACQAEPQQPDRRGVDDRERAWVPVPGHVLGAEEEGPPQRPRLPAGPSAGRRLGDPGWRQGRLPGVWQVKRKWMCRYFLMCDR